MKKETLLVAQRQDESSTFRTESPPGGLRKASDGVGQSDMCSQGVEGLELRVRCCACVSGWRLLGLRRSCVAKEASAHVGSWTQVASEEVVEVGQEQGLSWCHLSQASGGGGTPSP